MFKKQLLGGSLFEGVFFRGRGLFEDLWYKVYIFLLSFLSIHAATLNLGKIIDMVSHRCYQNYI